VLDGSDASEVALQSMLHWDVNNGIARRAWARNEHAIFAAKEAMKKEEALEITIPNLVDEHILKKYFEV
jgi:urocanate hydratase